MPQLLNLTLSTMGLFKSSKNENDSQDQKISQDPPSYDQLQQEHAPDQDGQAPQYSGNYGPNEYPPEKADNPSSYQPPNSGPGQNSGNDVYTVPANNTYSVAPQLVNIAYETDGKYTRPGYREYLQNDPQRIASGNGPKPREAFGRGGAPLSQGTKNNQKTGGGAFPGSSGPTYHNAANK